MTMSLAPPRTNGAGRTVVGIYGYCTSVDDTFGGVESHIGHLARALAAAGWEVVVHCLSAATAGWHVADGEFRIGPRTRQTAERVTEFVPAQGPGVAGAIAENIAASVEHREQAILAFGTRDGWVYDVAFAAADALDLPVVSFVYFTAEERWYRAQFTSRTRAIPGLADDDERALLDDHGQEVLRRVVDRSELVVVPTDYVRGQLSALLAPPAATKIVVVYHGVDPATFGRRTEPWTPGGAWLHVSRLSIPFAGHKNLAWSCQLVRACRDVDPAPRLKVCGSGNAAGLVAEYASQNGLDGRISTVGFVDQRALAAEMRGASLLLVPSMMEAGCTVIVEAVMSGCLPIVLDFAGNGELLRSLGLTDYLITPTVRDLGAGVRTIVPDLEHARYVVDYALRHPDRVNRQLTDAAAVASRRFSLRATTDIVTRHVTHLVTDRESCTEAVPS
jgi:glycosyltransferase involved in cell wall biosynthesis